MGAYRNINGVLRPQQNMVGRARQVTSGKSSNIPASSPLSTLRRLSAGEAPRICITRSLGGIGDVLMTTPLLKALKIEWPNCHITYATDFKYMDGALKDILQFNPYIDEIIPYQVAKGKKFDFVHDVTSVCIHTERANPRGCLNRIDIFANSVGVSLDQSGSLPIYVVSQEEQTWAKDKLKQYPRKRMDSPLIGIQVRASTQTRSWAIENMRDLALKLHNELGAQVLIFDSPHGQGANIDWNIKGVIPIIGYNVRLVAALINECDLLVAPDSGLMHVGGALNKRMVTLWAGTDYKARINHYPNAIAIARDDYKCYPCMYNPTACARAYTCVKSITIDEVCQTVNKKLNEPLIINEPLNDTNSSSICIRRDVGGLGDIINATVVPQAIRQFFPTKKIIVALPKQYHDVYTNNLDIDLIITPEQINEHKPGLIYDLTNVDARQEVLEFKQHKKILSSRKEIYLSVFRRELDPNLYKPKLVITQEELEWAKELINYNDKKKYIYIATGTAEQYRNWPQQHYEDLLEVLSNKKEYRILLGGTKRYLKTLPKTIHDVSCYGLRQLFSFIAISNLVVTPDTADVHIAGALDKKCFALYGPIDAYIRTKHYPNVQVVISDESCAPCWRNGSIVCKQTKTHDSLCMQKIQPKTVLELIDNYIKDLK